MSTVSRAMPSQSRTAPRHVTLAMTKTAANRVGWSCTCGHRLGGMTEREALSAADGHLRWHESRGDSTTQEAGGLS